MKRSAPMLRRNKTPSSMLIKVTGWSRPAAVSRGILLDAGLAALGLDSIRIDAVSPAGAAPYEGELTIAADDPGLMMRLVAARPPDFLALVDELRRGVDRGAKPELDLPVEPQQSKIIVTAPRPASSAPQLQLAPTTTAEAGTPAIALADGLPAGLEHYGLAPMNAGVAVLLEEAIGAVPTLARVSLPRVFGPQARAG
jgi:hypothetical protein